EQLDTDAAGQEVSSQQQYPSNDRDDDNGETRDTPDAAQRPPSGIDRAGAVVPERPRPHSEGEDGGQTGSQNETDQHDLPQGIECGSQQIHGRPSWETGVTVSISASP